MAFHFRLEKLLQYREEQKKIAQEELARRLRRQQGLQEELKQLEFKEKRLLGYYRELEGEKLDLLQLTAIDSYRHFLSEKIFQLRGELERCGEEVEKQRQEVVESWRRCQVLKKLKLKAYHHYREEEKAKEQREYDEIGLYSYIRKNGVERGGREPFCAGDK